MRETALKADRILLPKTDDMTAWATIACDQFTSEPNYWNELKEIVGDKKSTLNLTLPEIYLEDGADKRIEKINQNIKEYLGGGAFKTLEKGETPAIVKRHEQIAEHYKLPSIDYTAEIWARMQDKQFDWDTFGGTHPSPFGHRYYARAIENLFDMNSTSGKISKKALPKKFCQNPLENGRYVDVSNAKIKNGWYVEKNWQKKSKAYVRPRFKNLEILETRNSGAEFDFEFEGNTIGIYILAGEEAGILEYSIDGSPFKKFDTYTKYSHRLFLPSVAVFSNTLSEGKHKITIRMSEQKNPKSLGNACQIIKFAVNSK